jgi:hypothetical protein
MNKWAGENEPKAESWKEDEAVRLLKEVGAVVGFFEAKGARIPAQRREKCHARIVAAYKARDMEAYREAVNVYEWVVREAYRRLSRRGRGKAGE